ANEEICNTNKVSSFQALTTFVWRSVIQAKGLNPNQLTHCKLAANSRTRLEPPFPEEYFGNLLSVLVSTTRVGELLEQSFGQTALSLHQLVVNHTNKDVHNFVHSWFKSPYSFRFDRLLAREPNSTVHVGSSPRFNIYGNEFAGLGKPIVVRSGFANKFDGKLIFYPGKEGGGSIDVEICLPCNSMRALEVNEEFMVVVSSPK
ncbi:BAHD acyltransferase DCR-like, partial [Beta vulgaris subsp. vulgaris]|uniref:BAHD acyltransferase DCR-like n=1 Tax=Beta vulgaris subsp. vulgaris TaxID=3555 RepID=UPI0020375461